MSDSFISTSITSSTRNSYELFLGHSPSKTSLDSESDDEILLSRPHRIHAHRRFSQENNRILKKSTGVRGDQDEDELSDHKGYLGSDDSHSTSGSSELSHESLRGKNVLKVILRTIMF